MKRLICILTSLLFATAAFGQTYPFQYYEPANGIQKNTGTTYVNQAAVSADIIGLWTGTCSSTTFLRGDGACAGGGGGSGSVTSVALAVPTGFSVSGSPITTSGTITIATALSGVIKGTGSGFTTAAAADIYGLWSGTCSSSTFLRGDGACASASSGAVTSISAGTGITLSPSPITSTGSVAVNTSAGFTWAGQHTFEGPANSSYGLEVLDVLSTATAADIFLAGVSGFSNGFFITYDATQMQYNFQNGQITVGAAVSGNTLAVTGPASAYAATFSGSSTTGDSFGVRINAGTNGSDYALNIANQGSTLNLARFYGSGAFQIGNNGSANTITATSAGTVTISAASGATTEIIDGGASEFTEVQQGSLSTGSSYGPSIQAGSSSSDANMRWANAANSIQYGEIYGDGGMTLGSPTGGDKGVGTLNATALYVNGAAVANVAGSNTQLIYNNSGAFGGSSQLTWSGNTLGVTATSSIPAVTVSATSSNTANLQINGNGNAGSAGLNIYQDSTNVAHINNEANAALDLAANNTNEVVVTAGGVTVGSPTGSFEGNGTINATGVYVNGVGVGTVAGANTYVQYNNGSGFAADANFVWIYGSQILQLTGAASNPPLALEANSSSASAEHISAGSGDNATIQFSQSFEGSWTLGEPGSSGNFTLVDNSVGATRLTVSPGSSGTATLQGGSSGVALNLTGSNGQYAEKITGGSTSGSSYGEQILAGTTSADFAFNVGNQSGSSTFVRVYGDGGTVLGSATGGDEGIGTINATGVYVNGAAFTAPTTGSFTATAITGTGCGSGTAYYTKIGTQVTLRLPALSCSTNSAYGVSGLPSVIQPATQGDALLPQIDAGGTFSAAVAVICPSSSGSGGCSGAAGSVFFNTLANGSFSGAMTFFSQSITYDTN